MAPQSIIVAVAILIVIQIFSLLRNAPDMAMDSQRFYPAPKFDQEQIQSVLHFRKDPFPRKIWQTSKNGPAGLDDSDKEALQTWTKLNQKWRYEAITQYSAESYVRESFADQPEIIEIFTDLQDPILRADLIRYLVLLKDGGLYSDLDTKSLKPIDDWIPSQYRADTNVVIGVEYDRLQGGRWVDWTLDLQFTSWSILAKPKHPLLELTVQKVLRNLKNLAIQQDTSMAKLHPSYSQVLDATGPAAFSRAVFDYLSQQLGEKYTWENVTDLKAPRLVTDVLILPITAFGCGQWHSNAQGPEDPSALVQHLFKGSWKGDHIFHNENDGHDEEGTKKEEEQQSEDDEAEKKKQADQEEAEKKKKADEEEAARLLKEQEEREKEAQEDYEGSK